MSQTLIGPSGLRFLERSIVVRVEENGEVAQAMQTVRILQERYTDAFGCTLWRDVPLVRETP